MDHHPTLAPSSFPALQVCGHFVPTGAGSEASARGDRVHKLASQILEGVLIKPELAKDEKECAEWLVNKTKGLLEQVVEINKGVTISDPFTGETITHGTLDVWGYDPYVAPTVIDWKTGFPDDYFAQIKIYALGLMDLLKTDEVFCYILYGDHYKVQKTRVTRIEAEALINGTMARQTNPKSPYVQSKYCARCKLRPTCPAWVDQAIAVLAASEPSMIEEFKEGLDVIVKDPDKLGRFIRAWKALSQLVEDHDVTKVAINFIEHGEAVGNYEVRERKGRREYAKDSVQTMLTLVADGTLHPEEAAAMFKLDPKEVDTWFKDKEKVCPINTVTKGIYKILVEKNGR